MFKSSFHEKLDRNSFNEIIDNELEKIKQALIETLNIS
jgi:hypothetical protein